MEVRHESIHVRFDRENRIATESVLPSPRVAKKNAESGIKQNMVKESPWSNGKVLLSFFSLSIQQQVKRDKGHQILDINI